MNRSTTEKCRNKWGAGTLLLMGLLLPMMMVWTGTALAAGGDLLWQAGDLQAGRQMPVASAVDGNGNVVVTGYRNLGSGIDDDFYTVKFKQDGSGVAWTAAYDAAGGSDRGTAIAVDRDNNVIVAGNAWNGQNYDIRVIKYRGTPSGAAAEVIWADTYAYPGSPGGQDYATSLVVDGDNNIYVGGYTNGGGNDDFLIVKWTAAGVREAAWPLIDNAGSGDDRITVLALAGDGIVAGGYSQNAGGDFDFLVRKYDYNRGLLWEKRHSSPGSFDDRIVALKLNGAGDVIATGYFTDAVGKHISTIKLAAASGNYLWTLPRGEQVYKGVYEDEPTAVALDAAGDIYVTGYSFTLDGKHDFFTARYSGATGDTVWQKTFNSGSDYTDIATGIVVDEAGDVSVAGYAGIEGSYDFQTVKYHKGSGAQLWTRRFNGSANRTDKAVAVALSPERDLYVVGWSDKNGGSNDYDYYLVKYDYGRINPPTGLTAAAASDTSVNLAWTDNAANEEKFVIERKLGEGGTWAAISPEPAQDVQSLTDSSGLAPNNYYYYRIRAYNTANGYSSYSNEARVLTKVITYGVPDWTFGYGGSNEDVATSVAVGADDHPVVTGYSNLVESGTELDPEPTVSFDYYTLKVDRAAKTSLWQARYDSGSGGNDKAASVAVDAEKNVIVTGSSLVLGTGAQMGDPYSDDLYTIKYQTYQGPNGSDTLSPPPTLWEMQYGNKDDLDRAVMVTTATDGSNNVVVVGFGKNNAVPGNDDIKIVKYTPAGTMAWTPKVYDGGRNDYPTGVAMDGAGDIFVTGFSENAQGSTDFFTAKYSGTNGTLLWADTYANPVAAGDARAMSIAVDKAGDAFVTGYLVNDQTPANRDFFTIKYAGAADAVKRRVWEKRYQGAGNGDDWGVAVKLDPIDGAVVVAGTSFATPAETDIHLIRYRGTDGEVVWERNLDRSGSYEYLSAMEIDSSGYIYAAGNTRIGPQGDAGYDASSDMLSVIWDFEGTFLGAKIHDNGGKQDEARSIAVNYQGEAFIAGFKRTAVGDADYSLFKHKNDYILVPAPFAAVAQADYSKINLSWRENTGGTGFRIERTFGPANDASTWESIGTFPSGTLTHQDTGRSAGVSYCYRIDAFSGSISSRKLITCVTTTLPAPVLSPLTVDSSSQISLSWSSVQGSTGYRIERKTGSGGSWGVVADKGAGETTHQDSPLSPGTTYYYRIMTNSPSGYSQAGNESSAITRPAAPTLNAPTDGNTAKNQIALNWNGVTGAAAYTLQFKTEGGAWADAVGCTAITGTSCTVNSLVDDTLYYFQLKAANAGGDSAWSNTVQKYTKLVEPTLLTVTPASTGQLNIGWTDNTDKETGYVLEEAYCYDSNNNPANCGINGWWSGWTAVNGLDAASQPFQRSGLNAGSAYKYRLRAVNANHGNNYSAYSSDVVGWTWLNPPTLSSIEPMTQNSLKAIWTDVSGENKYTLERKQTSTGSWAEVAAAASLGANVLTYTDGSLSEQTEYCYRIKATNTYNGNAVYSTNELCKTTPLPSPVVAAVTALSTTQIKIDWTSVAGANGYEIQRAQGNYPDSPGYYIYSDWTTLPKISADPLEPGGTAHTFTDTVPNVGYTYRYRIRVTYGVSDFSGWSAEPYKYATTVPAAPAMYTPTANSTSQLTPSWGNVYGDTGYKLEWKERVGGDCTAGTWSDPIWVDSYNNYYSHGGLSQATWYCYRVRATNGLDSAYSNVVSQTTLLPAPVLELPTGVTTGKIDLSWNNITGNIGYDIYRSTDGVTYTYRGSSPQDYSYYSDTGLTAGTLYHYRVSAKNAGGLSAASNVQSATTTPAATSVTLKVASPWQIDLAWPVRLGATNYKIDRKESGGSYSEIENVAVSYEKLYCGSAYPTTSCQTLSDKVAAYAATGLKANTSYCFQVRAWNSTGGDSIPSTEACLSTLKLAAPTLSAAPVTGASIGLTATYDASACGSVSCTDIDGFELEVNLNGNWIRLATIAGTAGATYTDRVGVGPNTRHAYRARVFKGGEFSNYSAEAVTSTPSLTAAPDTCP
ncbi:fibronectin type III repeat protein [Geotalea daltonii FRC-32]|uniref:Fibronectin type III repeat protein n=1 Tax=Geotalea daltonii (strain DSM 22248 / JCM 15807 / FRC-32) TaxID=316067 RepID=B9M7A5_GEODF|nr:SBBP repeat-containing protein [Geotalea daltonii]ACM20193.1 fibronectin type III repeat protein [Geotalea daltonii FRC-32]